MDLRKRFINPDLCLISEEHVITTVPEPIKTTISQQHNLPEAIVITINKKFNKLNQKIDFL